jgi:hypothetical protein
MFTAVETWIVIICAMRRVVLPAFRRNIRNWLNDDVTQKITIHIKWVILYNLTKIFPKFALRWIRIYVYISSQASVTGQTDPEVCEIWGFNGSEDVFFPDLSHVDLYVDVTISEDGRQYASSKIWHLPTSLQCEKAQKATWF